MVKDISNFVFGIQYRVYFVRKKVLSMVSCFHPVTPELLEDLKKWWGRNMFVTTEDTLDQQPNRRGSTPLIFNKTPRSRSVFPCSTGGKLHSYCTKLRPKPKLTFPSPKLPPGGLRTGSRRSALVGPPTFLS